MKRKQAKKAPPKARSKRGEVHALRRTRLEDTPSVVLEAMNAGAVGFAVIIELPNQKWRYEVCGKVTHGTMACAAACFATSVALSMEEGEDGD